MMKKSSGITRIKSDRIIVDDKILLGYVYFENGIITAITDKELPYDKEYDATGLFVSPGFIDLHTHGGNGFEFFGSFEDVINGCNFHLTHGTTAICPTVSAAPFEVMSRAVTQIEKAKASEALKPYLIGIHLEGPYLAPEQCGGQCSDFIVAPVEEQYKNLVKKFKSIIARWTYAPEMDRDGAFAKYLSDNNIVPSAGHTNATLDDMKLALENGCNLITHLYSCTSTVTRKNGFRSLGVIESAYLMDELYVEIIADGRHLPPELIRMILKIKGTDKVLLCTDSLALAGTNITHGFTLGTEFIIEDGVCKLIDRSAFAGSIATADRLVRTMVKDVGLSVAEAVKMITKVPAEIMKLNKGMLSVGRDADIVIFDDDIRIGSAFVGGEIVYNKS